MDQMHQHRNGIKSSLKEAKVCSLTCFSNKSLMAIELFISHLVPPAGYSQRFLFFFIHSFKITRYSYIFIYMLKGKKSNIYSICELYRSRAIK